MSTAHLGHQSVSTPPQTPHYLTISTATIVSPVCRLGGIGNREILKLQHISISGGMTTFFAMVSLLIFLGPEVTDILCYAWWFLFSAVAIT